MKLHVVFQQNNRARRYTKPPRILFGHVQRVDPLTRIQHIDFPIILMIMAPSNRQNPGSYILLPNFRDDITGEVAVLKPLSSVYIGYVHRQP